MSNENDNTGLVVINQSSIYASGDDIIEYARNPHLNGAASHLRDELHLEEQKVLALKAEQEREHRLYVEQLKANYEDELERQQQVFEI